MQEKIGSKVTWKQLAEYADYIGNFDRQEKSLLGDFDTPENAEKILDFMTSSYNSKKQNLGRESIFRGLID